MLGKYEYESHYKYFNWDRKYVDDMVERGWELMDIITGDLYVMSPDEFATRQYQWIWKRLHV